MQELSGSGCSIQGSREKAVSHDEVHVITAPEKLQKWENLVMLTDFRTFIKYVPAQFCVCIGS